MLTLAESLLATLPSAGLFRQWVLISPLPLAVGLGVLGLAAGFVLNQRGKGGPALGIGGALVLVGGAVYLAGRFVQTDEEVLVERTRLFVDSFLAQDTGTLGDLLSDGVVVMSGSESYPGFGKSTIIRAADQVEQAEITDRSISWRGSIVEGENAGRTRFLIRVTSGRYGVVPTVWETGWRRAADGSWKMTRLQLLSVYGQTADDRPLGEMRRWAG